ncbi:hypothetical protein ES703_89411 [subsurface metagenome]
MALLLLSYPHQDKQSTPGMSVALRHMGRPALSLNAYALVDTTGRVFTNRGTRR